MKYRLSSLLFIVIVFLISCKPNARINEQDVESIHIYAMAKNIEFCHGIYSLREIQSQGMDTIITDRAFIKKFIGFVNNLRPMGKEYSIDCRCATVIQRKESPSITILFGESFGIVYENCVMKDNPDLFKLIDEQVYGTQPEDYWFSESLRTILREIQKIHIQE